MKDNVAFRSRTLLKLIRYISVCFTGVGFATRQMGNLAKPNLQFSIDDGVISMKSQSTFKTTEAKFKLNEEFDEMTADDRKTKVGAGATL